LHLQKNLDNSIQRLGSRTANTQKVVQYLYKRPSINALRVSEIAGVSMASAYKIITDLESLNVLREVTGSQRGLYYVFDNYLKMYK
jgi:hypothetical protein